MISPYRTIGIDVDETLANLHEPWTEWIRDTIDPDFPGFKTWDEPEERGLTGWREFVSVENYLNGTIEPFDEAYAGVARIRDAGFDIEFVTHCINGTADAKLDWLKGHGLWQPGDAFLATGDKTISDVDLLVDDGPKYVLASPVPAIMITRPHNEDISWGWRASDVLEAADMIVQEDKYAFIW